jgi:hypothetical protein
VGQSHIPAGEVDLSLTGESRIDPTRFIFILRINKFPICFMISLLGIPIFPVSDNVFGISFVCSIVELINSSNSEILTDCARACESESLVLGNQLSAVT